MVETAPEPVSPSTYHPDLATMYCHKAVIPEPAATLILVRETTAGLEVLLGKRNETKGIFGPAHIFPGGVVEFDDRYFPPPEGFDEPDLRYRVAALRETAEEVGIELLSLVKEETKTAEPSAEATLPKAKPADSEDSGASDLSLTGNNWAVADIIYISTWVTPPGLPRRYNTRFYLGDGSNCPDPKDLSGELSHPEWITAKQAMANGDSGEWLIHPPTYHHLEWIDSYSNMEELWEIAQIATEDLVPQIDLEQPLPA